MHGTIVVVADPPGQWMHKA